MQICKECNRKFDNAALICSYDGEILKNGSFLGQYLLEKKIGLGGMGFVYKAKHVALDRDVAIKILSPELIAGYTQAPDRFLREARIMAKLDHQNIIKISDFGADSQYAYFVMELLSGKSLEEKLREAKTLSPEETSHILSEICDAVTHAHENGVLHRDLKPSNIFLAATKTGEKIKVLDFGIAKILDPEATQLTQTGMIAGTPRYMSPEQRRGEKDIDQRADIYSLGIILYEMLCGQFPFESTTGCELSPQIAEVISKAMADERNKRQHSADELAKEFKTAVQSRDDDTTETRKMKNVEDVNTSKSSLDEKINKGTINAKNVFGKVVVKDGDFNVH